MRQNYKVLDTKKCEGIRFRIIRDFNTMGGWRYIIQYEIKCKGRYKKLWKFQKYQYALDDFDCENMLKRVVYEESLK